MFDEPSLFCRFLLLFKRKRYILTAYYCDERTTKTYHYKILFGRRYVISFEEKHDYDC